MFTVKKVDNQVFVFYRGKLIYKKWLDTGDSAVFGQYGEVFRKRKG